VKKFVDKKENTPYDEFQIRYILTRARIFDSLCVLFSVTFNVLSGGFVDGN